MDQIQRALKSQEYALQELKSDSLTLYNKAIQVFNKNGIAFELCTKKYYNKKLKYLRSTAK